MQDFETLKPFTQIISPSISPLLATLFLVVGVVLAVIFFANEFFGEGNKSLLSKIFYLVITSIFCGVGTMFLFIAIDIFA
ncbi:transmembrane protein [Anaeramoeba ignava]|uniref:Dolichyl-diphosphooligosaccharide-protein glycosyltransferase subunit OST5 n=1 Tax=Anaeramoeba ignava TaxID=1746090 RepID=A0A9Q0LGI0_ANAIG|nr:transmembrane protein [Anaeramoeba ignava]